VAPVRSPHRCPWASSRAITRPLPAVGMVKDIDMDGRRQLYLFAGACGGSDVRRPPGRKLPGHLITVHIGPRSNCCCNGNPPTYPGGI
jgi:hypothetical protein